MGYRALHGGSPEHAREQIDKIVTAYPHAERAVARAVRQNLRSALHRPIKTFLTDAFEDRSVDASALSATERTMMVVSWFVQSIQVGWLKYWLCPAIPLLLRPTLCRISDTHDSFLTDLVAGVPDKFSTAYTGGVPEARVAYYAYAAIMLACRIGGEAKLEFGKGRTDDFMPKGLKDPTPACVVEALRNFEPRGELAPMVSVHAKCSGVFDRCMRVSLCAAHPYGTAHTPTCRIRMLQFVAAHVAEKMTRASDESSSELVLFTPVKGAGAALQVGGGAALQLEAPSNAVTRERRPAASVPASAPGEGVSGRGPAAPPAPAAKVQSVPYTPQDILDFAAGLWYEVRIGCRPVRHQPLLFTSQASSCSPAVGQRPFARSR